MSHAGNAAELDEVIELVCLAASGVRGSVEQVVADQLDRIAPLLGSEQRNRVITRVVARLDGLDALDEHLSDEAVDEVMVNAAGDVWIDRHGIIEQRGSLPPGSVSVVLERVLAPTGRRLDRVSPIVDVRLPDGARLCAVVEPIAVGGTVLSIRRHRAQSFPLSTFAGGDVAELLSTVMSSRCNVLVSGATSSGKTSLVAALLASAAAGQRLVVCEDTAELSLPRAHTVRLEARPAAVDGVGAIGLAALVRAALRLRPDRLVVGEFRGDEVLAAVEAMNTGHDGSLATCHANSAVDALRRVETLMMQAAPAWPLPAIRRQVSRSIDVVVHLRRRSDGARRVSEVLEVVEHDGDPAGTTLAHDDVVIGRLSRSRLAGAEAIRR